MKQLLLHITLLSLSLLMLVGCQSVPENVTQNDALPDIYAELLDD